MVVEGAVKIKGDSKLLESITEMYGKRYGGSRKVMIEPLYREFNALGGGVKELQLFFEYVDRLTLDKRVTSKDVESGNILNKLYPDHINLSDLQGRIKNKEFDKVEKKVEEVFYKLSDREMLELVKEEWLTVDSTGVLGLGFEEAYNQYGDVGRVLILAKAKSKEEAVNYLKENCKSYFELGYKMGNEKDRKELLTAYLGVADKVFNENIKKEAPSKQLNIIRRKLGLPIINNALRGYLVDKVPSEEMELFYKVLANENLSNLALEAENQAEEWLTIGKRTNKEYTKEQYMYGYLYKKVTGKSAKMSYPVNNLFYLGNLGTVSDEKTPKKEILAALKKESSDKKFGLEYCNYLANLFSEDLVKVSDIENIGDELSQYLEITNESFNKILYRLSNLIKKGNYKKLYQTVELLPELTNEQETTIRGLIHK